MTDSNSTTDPIIEELHAVRRKLHDDCGGDLAKLASEMRARQQGSGHPVATVPVSGACSSNQDTESAKQAAKQ